MSKPRATGLLFRRAAPDGGRHDGGRGHGKGGHARGERVEPGDQARVVLAPGPGETEVAIAEHAGDRDLADIGRRIELRGCGFKRGKPARDLAGLQVKPLLLVLLGRAISPLVNLRIDASRMPSASASRRSASKRAFVSFGMMRPPPARVSRYSRMTGRS